MQSAGNDIVALELVNHHRSADSRFYLKILTDTEKELHHEPGIHPAGLSVFVWLCWSVKESAYKFLKRNQPELLFAPVRFVIQDIAVANVPGGFQFHLTDQNGSAKKYYSGSILAQGTRLYFTSVVDEKIIASVVSSHPTGKPMFSAIHEIGDDSAAAQSQAVREHCVLKLQEVYPLKKIQIHKHAVGYPIVWDGAGELALPLSFAHHGRYVIYSFPG